MARTGSMEEGTAAREVGSLVERVAAHWRTRGTRYHTEALNLTGAGSGSAKHTLQARAEEAALCAEELVAEWIAVRARAIEGDMEAALEFELRMMEAMPLASRLAAVVRGKPPGEVVLALLQVAVIAAEEAEEDGDARRFERHGAQVRGMLAVLRGEGQ